MQNIIKLAMNAGIKLDYKAISIEKIANDWMHDTARCLGYPSDSTRAARERARETTCVRHLRRAGQARPGWTPPSLASAAYLLAPAAQLSPPWLDSPPPWLISRPRGSTWQHRLSSPRGSTLRPCGSTLSHLAGVGG